MSLSTGDASGRGFEFTWDVGATTSEAFDALPGQLRQLARVRRPGDAAVLPHRLSRWPTASRSAAAATRTCCCSWSSRRSSRASSSGRSRGGSSSATTAPFLAIVRDTLGHRPAELQHPRHAAGGRLRPDLPVPAVHGPAALRLAREDRPAAHRGGPDLYAGPWRPRRHHRRRRSAAASSPSCLVGLRLR